MGANEQFVKLKPINVQRLLLVVEGTTPLIQHKWSEKAIAMMRAKHGGKKTKDRSVRDPQQEARDATYLTKNGKPGVPLLAIKSAIIEAAHKDIGVEKTLVRKALFIKSPDESLVLPMKASQPEVREDCVRVGMGSTDLRYRPQFNDWEVQLSLEYDADLLSPDDIVNLINRAGFGVGIGEWRPEKGGEFGRFRVKADAPAGRG